MFFFLPADEPRQERHNQRADLYADDQRRRKAPVVQGRATPNTGQREGGRLDPGHTP